MKRSRHRTGGLSAAGLAASAAGALTALTRVVQSYALRKHEEAGDADKGGAAGNGTAGYTLDLPLREAIGDAELSLSPDGSWTVTVTVIPADAEPVVEEPIADGQESEESDLPPLVDIVRATIVKATRAREFDVLEELAFAVSDEFTYSFDEPVVAGSPARFWSDLEGQGAAVLAVLGRLLELPHARSNGIYIWPSIAAQSWSEIGDVEREALCGTFGEEQLSFWEEIGAYLGYRVGIDARGDWKFFIAS